MIFFQIFLKEAFNVHQGRLHLFDRKYYIKILFSIVVNVKSKNVKNLRFHMILKKLF